MRASFTLLLIFLALAGNARTGIYEQLCRLNAGWKEQKDVHPERLPAFAGTADADWIALHLELVEAALRARPTARLTAKQAAARLRNLDELRRYRLARCFPRNEWVPGRRPVFIDCHDNFCAVGHLIKASGQEKLSRYIAAHTNLAYVEEMRYPELDAWAAENGLEKEELAWIQPAYGYAYEPRPVGKGTDGAVHELCPSPDGERLYVGGSFHLVDGAIPASNIAYLTKTDTVYAWHSLGGGTNGPVNAIAVHHDTLFIAGRFDSAGGQPVHNVAYWAGGSWHDANCTYGTIHDLISLNGALYAAGDFDVCAALAEVNFAEWKPWGWQQHPGLDGHVNTMEAVGNSLLLGGAFTYQGQMVNAIRYDPLSAAFLPYPSAVKNEVLDFGFFKDSLYASCRRTATKDSVLLMVLRGGDWRAAARQPGNGRGSDVGPAALHTLCDADGELFIGGYFLYGGVMPPMPKINCVNLYPKSSYFAEECFETDSSIYKFTLFKGKLLMGGAFGGPDMRGIAQRVRITPGVSVRAVVERSGIRIFPNPVEGNGRLHLESATPIRALRLTDALGREVQVASPAGATTIDLRLPALPAGMYVLECTDAQGGRQTQPVQIQ